MREERAGEPLLEELLEVDAGLVAGRIEARGEGFVGAPSRRALGRAGCSSARVRQSRPPRE
jgi:hypothetical protein